MDQSFLSRNTPIRRLHQCILDYDAYSFWSTLFKSSSQQSGTGNNRELFKSKKLNIPIKTDSGRKIVLTVENMVMRMELKNFPCDSNVLSEKIIEYASKLPFNQDPKDSDSDLQFIETERTKFNSYVEVLESLKKDPDLSRYKKHLTGYSNDNTTNTIHPSYSRLSEFRINLQKMALTTNRLGSQFNNKKFSSVNCRFFPLTLCIFPHGRVSSTGSTHEIASLLAFQQMLNIMRELFGPLAFEDPYVNLNNLVLSGFTGYPLCLGLLVEKYPSYLIHIRDFSGISFVNPHRKDKSTVLIFKPGTFCYTGAKNIESVLENMRILAPMLESCMPTTENIALEANITHSWPRSRANKSISMYDSLQNTRSVKRHPKTHGKNDTEEKEEETDNKTEAENKSTNSKPKQKKQNSKSGQNKTRKNTKN